MSDTKYGRIFSEEDVKSIVEYALEHGFETEEETETFLSDYEGKSPSDEPVFVLRGQDNFAVATLERYVELCRSGNPGIPQVISSAEHQNEAIRALEGFREFQRDNAERVKVPD